MDFGYFHEEESEQFAFYRIPKVLFKDEKFAKFSTDAKVLYVNPKKCILIQKKCSTIKNSFVVNSILKQVFCSCFS